MANFNKLINLTFQTSTGKQFTIETPKRGIKPQIEISGNLTMEGYSHTIEVRVTNLFTDSIDGDITSLSIEAGYEGEMSAGVYGTVQNVYTESPGPDKVTVLSCVSASYDAWINKTINMKLKEGYTLETAITQVTNALGYDPAIIDTTISGSTCAAPLFFNGRCSEALSKIKEAFPGVTVIVDGNKLRVFPTESKRSSVVVHNLALLSQTPQFSGGTVSLVAPWNPMIKPGDFVHFPTKFFRQSLGAITTDTAEVQSIQFHFATNTDVNEMIISGTPNSKLKEAK